MVDCFNQLCKCYQIFLDDISYKLETKQKIYSYHLQIVKNVHTKEQGKSLKNPIYHISNLGLAEQNLCNILS